MPINIEITQKAQDEIRQLLSNEKEGSFFRISVQGGGCSGFKYNFIIDTKINEDDLKIDAIVIDSTSLQIGRASCRERV